MFHKIQILPASIQKPISWNSSIYRWAGGGNISQLVYLTPHTRFWKGDCLQIMKWLWSITLFKMMKISYNPDIFCFFTPISHLKYLRWRVGGGGNLSQLVYLAPHPDFCQWLAMDLSIALNCFNNYKRICSTKYRYCLLVYTNQFIEIHPYTGGGQHSPAGLPYPPPKILEQWLFTDYKMTFKYYII